LFLTLPKGPCEGNRCRSLWLLFLDGVLMLVCVAGSVSAKTVVW